MVLENLIIKEIGLSLDLFRRLVGECDEVILKKKEYLLRQGQVCSFIGFVETGVLRSYIEKEGEDYISDFHFQGSFATSYRSFKRIKYLEENAKATDVNLLPDDISKIELLLKKYPNIGNRYNEYDFKFVNK